MNEPKNWQHGYDLEYLKGIESYYKKYNSYTFSPFAQYKKNDIAKDLHEGKFKIQINYLSDTATAAIQTVKVASDIILYQDIKIGRKLPKDVLVTRLQGISSSAIQALLLDATNKENTWVYTWAEDYEMRNILEDFHFEYVGPKVTSFGEIYAIYFKNSSFAAFEPRKHIKIDPIEWISCKQIGQVRDWMPTLMAETLEMLDMSFTNHYSNYNAKKSWSALSLRGYSSDPSFIIKPSEMNDKWQEEHKGETFCLQNTHLYDSFLWLHTYLYNEFGSDIHRVRLMKLEPNGGELRRHTDLVDIDSGLGIGKLARIHIPIITNDDVEFTSWSLQGKEQTFNMKVGEMWVLDTRKPHRVVNKGTTARVHLVIDVVVDQKLYDEILRD